MNQCCPHCKIKLDECDTPSLVRVYHPKEDQPKPVYVLGYLDENGDFTPDEHPDFRGIPHDLVDEDRCLGCIAQQDNMLRVQLFAREGSESLPHYAYIRFTRADVEKLIEAQKQLVGTYFNDGSITLPLRVVLSNHEQDDTDFNMADNDKDHDEFCDVESIIEVDTQTRLSQGGIITVTVQAKAAHVEFVGDTDTFYIHNLLEFDSTNFLTIEDY